MKKEYYYVIDEAGTLNLMDKSKVFILGCLITDTPDSLRHDITRFLDQLKNSSYFQRHIKQLNDEGLHACSNHPDIYSRFIELMNGLNFRCYFILINKTSENCKNKLQNNSEEDIYNFCVKKLLKDRFVKRKLDGNIITFEQNLPNPSALNKEKRKNEITGLINNINIELLKLRFIPRPVQFQVLIKEKSEDCIISVIDYMNHVLSKIYEGKSGIQHNYIKENYELLEKKIAFIYEMDKDNYVKIRKNGIDIEKVLIK